MSQTETDHPDVNPPAEPETPEPEPEPDEPDEQ